MTVPILVKQLAAFDPYQQDPSPHSLHHPTSTTQSESDHQEDGEWHSYNQRTILRPALFTAGIVVASFGAASYYRAQERWKSQDIRSFISLEQLFGSQRGFNQGSGASWIPEPMLRVKGMIQDEWNRSRTSQRTVYAIIGLNALVFLAWRAPSLQSFMMRHFTHHPLSGRSYTLLTSAFSHESFMHFAFNMYALYGFAPIFQDHALGSWEEMTAVYLSAAVLASFASHLLSSFNIRKAKPSLGASGAVWAIIAGMATILPQLPVSIIFIPGMRFTMGDLVPFLVGVDVAGLACGWQFFDHAAHLGGAAFGYAYTKMGHKWWNEGQLRLDAWHREGRI
ncbi:hypothetical protein DFS34DRAFT_592514 [Phlyctochytrium arcticum]|nr:hypothetical protein DFS34DRAFT_592514 [Phlyctochytrium arcticum]